MTREEMWKEFENQLIRETRISMSMSFDAVERTTILGIKETFAKWKDRLEQEPCEDCVSRKAVLEVIDDCHRAGFMSVFCSYKDGERFKKYIKNLPSVTPTHIETVTEFADRCVECGNRYGRLLKRTKWIPVSERLPETNNENEIDGYNVLLWVANKTHPEREPQIYLGKLKKVDGDDGSGNFWGIKTEPCDWTIWGWRYFNEPEVIAWLPLPEPYKAEMESEKKVCNGCHYNDGEVHAECVVCDKAKMEGEE